MTRSDPSKQQLTTLLLLGAALVASLRLYCLSNPFYIPTIDDSAIVMRYLVNFQHGYFFSYNPEDGPVYGISCFWLGLAAGALSWAGLEPQAALMTVALVSTLLFFFAALRVCQHATGNPYAAIVLGACVFYASLFIPKTMFLGLETPLHLWLVTEMILAFLKKQTRLFYFLCAFCIISKLDASFMVACLGLLKLHEAHKRAAVFDEIKEAVRFFVVPILTWLVIATLIFGNPIPQSFLSKFFLRQKAAKTSWFPFLEPLIDSPPSLKSLLWMCVSMTLAIALRVSRKVSVHASSTFAILFIGTMALYYVYNPGEKMPWYYPLPEFLALMSVACLPVNIFTSKEISFASKLVLLLVSAGILITVTRMRAPLNRGAIKAAQAWQVVQEKERMDSGLLANAVAPKQRPVLWTGHGYPAYLFHGYVADYAGLNFRKIWPAVEEARHPSAESIAFLRSMGLSEQEIQNPGAVEYKAGLLLMKNHQPNVYMQHSLFPPAIQKARHMRLAGSFYTIDLVGAPAFRIFVEDKDWHKFTVLAPEADIRSEPPLVAPHQLAKQGTALFVRKPQNATEFLFGVEKGRMPTMVSIDIPNGSMQSCSVPAIENIYKAPEVHACKIDLPASLDQGVIKISAQQGVEMRVYEPAFTMSE